MRVIQVDFAVRDDRSLNGWVFGTFVYNGGSKETNVCSLQGLDPSLAKRGKRMFNHMTGLNAVLAVEPSHSRWSNVGKRSRPQSSGLRKRQETH
jgi:hypothetical protein